MSQMDQTPPLLTLPEAMPPTQIGFDRSERGNFRERLRKIRFIVSDMDGTLLGKDNLIPADNIRAIQRLREAGIRFTFATGRIDYTAREYARQLELTEPVISCNGALVRDLRNGEVFVENQIERETGREILRYFNAQNFDILVYEKDRMYYPEDSIRIQVYHHYNALARKGGSEPARLIPFRKVDKIFSDDQDFIKFFIFQPDQSKLQAAARLMAERYPELYYVQSTPGSLDITAKGTTKGSAVAALARANGLSPDEIAVFGDQDNDVSMFREAGVCFAMRNGSRRALAAGDRIVDHHSVAGFGRAVTQYFLDF